VNNANDFLHLGVPARGIAELVQESQVAGPRLQSDACDEDVIPHPMPIAYSAWCQCTSTTELVNIEQWHNFIFGIAFPDNPRASGTAHMFASARLKTAYARILPKERKYLSRHFIGVGLATPRLECRIVLAIIGLAIASRRIMREEYAAYETGQRSGPSSVNHPYDSPLNVYPTKVTRD
jgi:hypothetical protein